MPEVVPPPPHRVVAGCAVEDLADLAKRLAGGDHGISTGLLMLADGGRRLGLASRYGAALEFWQRSAEASAPICTMRCDRGRS